MIKNVFSKYMVEKLQETQTAIDENIEAQHHPFITISREYGCGAHKLGENLVKALSQTKDDKGKQIEWKFVDQEIIAEAAREIGVAPEIIKEMSYQKIEDMVSSIFDISFSKYQKPSVLTVRNTLANIVINMAKTGYVVMLGRGGASLTRNMVNSFHVRLQAPIEWRVNKVIVRENLPKDKAQKILFKIDKDRYELRSYFEGKKSDKSLFDVIYNTTTMKNEEIIASILATLKVKGMIQ